MVSVRREVMGWSAVWREVMGWSVWKGSDGVSVGREVMGSVWGGR